MGFARNWGPSSAAHAALVENAIRLGVPGAAAAAGYGGYQVGKLTLRWFDTTDEKR
jgi:hypothetical protein